MNVSKSLPYGLKTIVGERGDLLSGGLKAKKYQLLSYFYQNQRFYF